MSPQVSSSQMHKSGSDQSGRESGCRATVSLEAQRTHFVWSTALAFWKPNAAEGEAVATGSIALTSMQAGWTVERVAAELVHRQISMSSESLEDEHSRSWRRRRKRKKKRKKQEWWAQQQQNKRKRQRQRGEKRRLLAIGDGGEKADEEQWHEMSCAFVEEAAMAKAVAWREGRQCLSAWRDLDHWRVMSGGWNPK